MEPFGTVSLILAFRYHRFMSPEHAVVGPRERILAATATLIADGGRDAVSTRAVAVRAGVQAPAIYRIFGDKRGLLDAVVARGFSTYWQAKNAVESTDDPVEDLRRGWDLHVDFGLTNPALFLLMCEPRSGRDSVAAQESSSLLHSRIRNIGELGGLRVEESHAVDLVRAACTGTIITLIGMDAEKAQSPLSTMAREAALSAILTATPAAEATRIDVTVATLRAALPKLAGLTPAECLLLGEWLDRATG